MANPPALPSNDFLNWPSATPPQLVPTARLMVETQGLYRKKQQSRSDVPISSLHIPLDTPQYCPKFTPPSLVSQTNRRMLNRFTFLRVLAWVGGTHALLFGVYFVLISTAGGRQDWFQAGIWKTFGQAGARLLEPFIEPTWEGLGALLINGLLVGMTICSVGIAFLTLILNKRKTSV